MSVAQRPWLDPRNTYIVDNNDPKAFNKSFRGKPGTHTEQRCCEDKAPHKPGVQTSAFYTNNRTGEKVSVIDYWGRPENRAGAPSGWWNAATPNGWTYGATFADNEDPKTWYCEECTTAVEQTWAMAVGAFNDTIPAQRIIAMAISYIPVFGTAISFCINTSLSLYQGEDIDQSVLDGIGGALPGQPVSQMAFNAVRSIANGDRIDMVAIETLPIDETEKSVVKVAVVIVEAIAQGQNLADTFLNQVYQELPPAGQKAMDIAKDLAKGKPVSEVAKKELGEAAANAMQYAASQIRDLGDEAMRSFIVQSGYQAALDTISPELRDALTAAIIAGKAELAKKDKLLAAYPPPGVFTTKETDQPTNDAYYAKGLAIVNGGATVRAASTNAVFTLSELLSRPTMQYAHYRFDSLSGQTDKNLTVESAIVDDAFRRGFTVAIGACEGMSLDGPGQQKIRASLTLNKARIGFDAGQWFQFQRTQQSTFYKGLDNMAISLGRVLMPVDRNAMLMNAAKGKAIADTVPQVASARSLQDDPLFKWGFDVATGLCQGMSLPGPGQDAVRTKLGPFYTGSSPDGMGKGSNQAIMGFDVGQALQYGITKAQQSNQAAAVQAAPPNVGAGMLLAAGLAGSGTAPSIKTAVIAQTLSDPGAKAGAQAVIDQHVGFFTKILQFFGLA